MRVALAGILILVTGVCSLPHFAFADSTGAIAGVVRDSSDAPLAGAHVTLKSSQPAAMTKEVTTGSAGEYQFAGLQAGAYSLSAQMNGFTPASQEVEISTDGVAVRADFKLAPGARVSGGAPTVASSTPPPKFQAAGVRGLIDAGGYSAAADGAAATGLIKGIADIKRTDNELDALAAAKWPCKLGPELRSAADANPTSGDANRKLGEFYLAHDQPNRAIPYFERARTANPGDLESAKGMASAFLRLQKFDESRQVLAKESESDDPEIHTLLARADEGSGLFKDAAAQYQLASRLAPTEERLFGVGYERILDGSTADALKAFDAGLTRYPDSMQILLGAGTAEFLSGNAAQSIRYFLRAADLAPTDPRPSEFLAKTPAATTEEIEQIQSRLKRFLTLAPDSADANYLYALSLWNVRSQDAAPTQTQEIEILLHRAIQLRPNFARAHYQLANVYFEREDYNSAIPEYEESLRLAPDLNEARYRLSRSYQFAGQKDLAAKEASDFQRAAGHGSAMGSDASISVEQFISVIAGVNRQASNKNTCDDKSH